MRVCACNCALHGRVATPPPTHKHTQKIKSRSRAVSFQSLPSFLSPCPRALKASLSSSRAFRALMDRRRMDADGGRGVHRDRRTRKLAVVVAVQNVLVAACLLVTLYVYWDVQRRTVTSGDYVHIQFDPIADIPANETLKFSYVHSNNMMSLDKNKNDTIYVNCTGPYILYIDVCYKSLSEEETGGMLQLQVAGSKTPVSSLALNASSEVCRGLYSIAFLRATELASLYFHCADGFKIKTVAVSLSYLLGGRCEF